MRRLSTLSLGWLLILVAPSAFGQTPTQIEAAKKEGGKVIVYTSMETFTADALQKAFQSKTGLQMNTGGRSSTEVMDRALASTASANRSSMSWRPPAIICS